MMLSPLSSLHDATVTAGTVSLVDAVSVSVTAATTTTATLSLVISVEDVTDS